MLWKIILILFITVTANAAIIVAGLVINPVITVSPGDLLLEDGFAILQEDDVSKLQQE